MAGFLCRTKPVSRAGQVAPSCPLGQPITARDSVRLARSRSQSYNKLRYYLFFLCVCHCQIYGHIVSSGRKSCCCRDNLSRLGVKPIKEKRANTTFIHLYTQKNLICKFSLTMKDEMLSFFFSNFKNYSLRFAQSIFLVAKLAFPANSAKVRKRL